MMDVIKFLFSLLIFPGFLFTAVLGMTASSLDRKLSARFQFRRGPPWYQPLADLLKLAGKSAVVPAESSRGIFILAPMAAVGSAAAAAALTGLSVFQPKYSFSGDLIVAAVLFALPALAAACGGFASRHPLASLGASRMLKLLAAFEVPFLLALAAAAIDGGSIRLADLIRYQAQSGILLGSASGFIAFLVGLSCQQAALSAAPFNIPDAETEISAGPYEEYSGVLLGLFNLARIMILGAWPLFLVSIFWGGFAFSGPGIIAGIAKYAALLAVIIAVKNVNPRLRIDQAMKFFWGPVAGLAVVAVVLALLGL